AGENDAVTCRAAGSDQGNIAAASVKGDVIDFDAHYIRCIAHRGTGGRIGPAAERDVAAARGDACSHVNCPRAVGVVVGVEDDIQLFVAGGDRPIIDDVAIRLHRQRRIAAGFFGYAAGVGIVPAALEGDVFGEDCGVGGVDRHVAGGA